MANYGSDDYSGETVTKPMSVESLVTLLSTCNGSSRVEVNSDNEILVTSSSGEVELHIPFSETFLKRKDGELVGQNYDCYIVNNPTSNRIDADETDALCVGAIVQLPGQRLKIVAVDDFTKSPFFPGAVAEAVRVGEGWVEGNSHIRSPWGMIKVL